MKRSVASRRTTVRKQLGVALAVAVSGAAVVGATAWWEQRTVQSGRLVRIYRTHGCTCAFVLADSLEAAGFEVSIVELATLTTTRRAFHVPADFHGCHTGAYLDYFLEGHVTPAALSALSQQRPAGVGVVTSASASASAADGTHLSIALDERSIVLLVAPDGTARPWFEPN